MPDQPEAHDSASTTTARRRRFDRRRLLAAAALGLGSVAATGLAACSNSDRFDFKPRREGITGAGST